VRVYRVIKGRDIGGAYITGVEKRITAADRRRLLDEAALCINGGSHGARTHGVRCLRCHLVHKFGKRLARQQPEWPTDQRMQERLLCALGTVDRDLEQRTRMALASDEPGCKTCPTLADEITALRGARLTWATAWAGFIGEWWE
jgi:hypothetical protein